MALRVVDSLKVLFTPVLPFSSQKLHELLGYEGWLAGPLEFREIEEDDGEKHTILAGDYSSWVGRWEPSELPARRLRLRILRRRSSATCWYLDLPGSNLKDTTLSSLQTGNTLQTVL